MNENKFDEVKDKVVGEVKETTGDVVDNKELEAEGKLQKDLGTAREIVGDLAVEMDDVKDKVLGGLKEATGKFTDDEELRLKGKLQKDKVTNPKTNKIIGGLGTLAGLYVLQNMFRRKK